MDLRRDFFLILFVVVAGLMLVPPGEAQQASPGQSSSSSSSSATHHARKPLPAGRSRLNAGSVSDGTYRNPDFGFTCKIPAGWVLRTDEMNLRQDEETNDEETNTGAGKPAMSASQAGGVLLAAFSRPPEARGEDVNSSILIAAESAASYPGLKEAAQYFGPVTEIAKAQGFAVVSEPYEFGVGSKTVVRGDFQKDVGTRVMRQATLAVLARGYAVSFTFIGGTEDEVEELVQGLNFAPAAKSK